MCIPRWYKRFLFCKKALSPCLHYYGFSLTCIHFLWERFITLPALLWFLPNMYPKMWYESTLNCESLATLATLIWFIYSVCPLKKLLLTLVGFIWYLPSVCLQMIYKIYILWESIATMAALIWLSPVYICWCISSSSFFTNTLWHWLHW